MFDKDFAERVFVYNYRIYDRYRRPVSSLAVLADGNAHWKPDCFGYELFGCEMRIRFPHERGLERGRQEALCSLVGSQLAKRFGTLPPTVQERLRHATPAQLQAWGEAVLDAPTLDGVFARG